MTIKTAIAAAAGVAALALSLTASAQSWYGDRGDYNQYRNYGRAFSGYPQFSAEKAHIRSEIREGLNEGWIDGDEARDLNRRLAWVQQREYREFNEHGWALPSWDAQQIQASLDQVDSAVDRARDQGDSGWDRGERSRYY